jgi:hypothetical protein
VRLGVLIDDLLIPVKADFRNVTRYVRSADELGHKVGKTIEGMFSQCMRKLTSDTRGNSVSYV